MSQTYIAVLVNLLVQFLPQLGVNVLPADLTVTIQTLVAIGSAAWVLIRRYQNGDVTPLGVRK